jgi:hypothetical protein
MHLVRSKQRKVFEMVTRKTLIEHLLERQLITPEQAVEARGSRCVVGYIKKLASDNAVLLYELLELLSKEISLLSILLLKFWEQVFDAIKAFMRLFDNVIPAGYVLIYIRTLCNNWFAFSASANYSRENCQSYLIRIY